MENLPTEGIPKTVLYGIPLAMCWRFTKPFWHLDGDTQENCKIGAINKKIESAREAEFKLHLDDNTINKVCNARQAILQLKNEKNCYYTFNYLFTEFELRP